MIQCSNSSCYDGFPRQRRLGSLRRWDGPTSQFPIHIPFHPSTHFSFWRHPAPQPQRPCGHHVAGIPVTIVGRSPVTMGVPVRKGNGTGRYRLQWSFIPRVHTPPSINRAG